MTNPRYHHNVLIIDRSGSIQDILEGMQDGFREFCRGQAALQKDGIRVTGSLWQFDDEVDCFRSLAPINELTAFTIAPRGWTALYDAVGIAVTTEGAKLAEMAEDERPGLVRVLIASDGKENRSKEYDGSRIAEMLKHQQEAYGWQVVFLGTNQDVFAEGAKMSIGNDKSLSYENTSAGAQQAWKVSSRVAADNSRRTVSAHDAGLAAPSFAYGDEDRKEAAGGAD